MIRSRFRRLDFHTFGVLLGAAAAVLALLPATASGQTQTWAIAGQVTVPIDGVPMTFQIPRYLSLSPGVTSAPRRKIEPFNVNGCQTGVTSTFNGSFDRVLNLTWNGTVTSTRQEAGGGAARGPGGARAGADRDRPASECFNGNVHGHKSPVWRGAARSALPERDQNGFPGDTVKHGFPGDSCQALLWAWARLPAASRPPVSRAAVARRRRRRRRRSFRRTLRQVRRRLWALSHWRRRQFRRRTSGSASNALRGGAPD